MKMLKRIIATSISFSLCFCLSISTVSAQTVGFNDVPSTHWSYEYVTKLKELGITTGIGDDNFGLGKTITRAEFVSFLCNMMKWEKVTPSVSAFTDNRDINTWYYSSIETALQNGVISVSSLSFRPNEPITREEMAVMLINSLGYEELAGRLDYLGNPFSDVVSNKGYITMAKDLGIISGTSDSIFAPNDTATREQAATMMVRMYELLQNKEDMLNGFYAIKSSSQIAAISKLDTVSFGWSRIETDGVTLSLNTTYQGNNEYNIPDGWETPWQAANGKTKLLMVAVKDEYSSDIINNPDLRQQAVTTIANAINLGLSENKLMFDGVVVDFEALKGKESQNNYNDFLTKLRQALGNKDKLIYVAVQPQRRAGHDYYDGYDYRTIGNIADKVILMAHDYNPKILTPDEMAQGIVMTPVAPIDEVYYALKAATDKTTGVENPDKIMLQFSFGTAQWKLKNGVVLNEKPYTPDYNAVVSRIQSGAERKYSTLYESPYITFLSEEDGADNVLWYEDTRSINAKMQLALLFGIKDASLWRLGIVPDYDSNINLNVMSNVLAW